MIGTLVGGTVLAIGLVAAVFTLRRGRRRKGAQRRIHMLVAGCIGSGLVLIGALHQLSRLQLVITQTQRSIQADNVFARTQSVDLRELLAFRSERSCPESARALCDHLAVPGDTLLRVTSFRLEEGLCGLPLADTIQTTARVELELKWLRAGTYKSGRIKTSIAVRTNAFGIYSCSSVRDAALTELAEALSREIAKVVPSVPLGIVQDVHALTSGPGHICAIMADRTVRCFGAQSSITAPEGLEATAIGISRDAVCAVDEKGTLSCSVWEGGNEVPKPAQKICAVSNLRSLAVSRDTKIVLCGIDSRDREACVAVDPAGTHDCAAFDDAFEKGRHDVREIAQVGSLTCMLSRDGAVSCGGASLPREMRNAAHIRRGSTFDLCTLSKEGIVRCTSPYERSETPARVRTAEFPGATRFAADVDDICGVVPPGRVRCTHEVSSWNGLPNDPFPELDDAVDVAMDASLVCALTTRRSLVCMYGQGRAPATGSFAASGFQAPSLADPALALLTRDRAAVAKTIDLTKPFSVPLR